MAVQLELRYRGLRSPHKIKLGVSGCARECAEARGKDVGVIATEAGWNMYVGGNGGFTPRHAVLFAEGLDDAALLQAIDRFLMYYIRTADRLQRTAPWFEEMEGGVDALRAVIFDDSLGIAADLDAAMAAHVDALRGRVEGDARRPREAAPVRVVRQRADHARPVARLHRGARPGPAGHRRGARRTRACSSPARPWRCGDDACRTCATAARPQESPRIRRAAARGLGARVHGRRPRARARPAPRSSTASRSRCSCTHDGRVHAVQQLDPYSGAYVMSRGIVGTQGGRADRRLADVQAGLRPAHRRVPRDAGQGRARAAGLAGRGRRERRRVHQVEGDRMTTMIGHLARGHGRSSLVGGGDVAARRIRRFLLDGAIVRVVAPELGAATARLVDDARARVARPRRRRRRPRRRVARAHRDRRPARRRRRRRAVRGAAHPLRQRRRRQPTAPPGSRPRPARATASSASSPMPASTPAARACCATRSRELLREGGLPLRRRRPTAVGQRAPRRRRPGPGRPHHRARPAAARRGGRRRDRPPRPDRRARRTRPRRRGHRRRQAPRPPPRAAGRDQRDPRRPRARAACASCASRAATRSSTAAAAKRSPRAWPPAIPVDVVPGTHQRRRRCRRPPASRSRTAAPPPPCTSSTARMPRPRRPSRRCATRRRPRSC